MKCQIIYAHDRDDSSLVHKFFRDEEVAMREAGIPTSLSPSKDAENLILRTYTIYKEQDYPADSRFVDSYKVYNSYLDMHLYYPHIEGLTMDTFFADKLDGEVEAEIKRRGWKKAFIKGDFIALEHIQEGLSVWPDHSFDEMMGYYSKFGVNYFCIREYYEPERLEEDHRYWVINGKIYRNNNIIPEVVREAAKRLSALGGAYYAIDATPEFVIEVNPGESSDRHGENSAELFASWFKDAFSL